MEKVDFGKKVIWRIEYQASKNLEDRRAGLYCTKVFYILAEDSDQVRRILDAQEHDCGYGNPLFMGAVIQAVDIYE